MPTTDRPLAFPGGDSMQLLATTAMTGGAFVRARIVFKGGGHRVRRHLHPRQVEHYEVLAGRLAVEIGRTVHVLGPGERITIPLGVRHRHYAAGPEDAVAIETMTPGLDFDYQLESFFGLGADGRFGGLTQVLHALVWIHSLRSAVHLAGLPVWLQRTAAAIVDRPARWAGVRAVYARYSGEER